MAGEVKFDEWRPSEERQTPPSGLVKFAMKYLGAKNEHAANTVLLGAAVVFFALTLFVIFLYLL
jgi:hypothetical protein